MKPIHPTVIALNARIFEHRLTVGQVLRRAPLHRSTWSRWVKGAEPRISNIEAMNRAIDGIVIDGIVADRAP